MTPEKEMKYKYSSLFFAPRKFANEGTYIYGTSVEIEKFSGTITRWENIGWWCEKQHRSERTARERCERDARKDRNSTPSHEICCIGSAHVAEML